MRSESLSGSDVTELESHLREEIEHLTMSGLSAEEAFLVARHRLGDATRLESEFAKVNIPRRATNPLWWMAAGVLACLTAIHFGSAASRVSLEVMKELHLGSPMPSLVTGSIWVVVFGITGALVLRLNSRRRPPDGRWSPRTISHIRMAVLVGLFVEILMVALTRIAVWHPVPAFMTMTAQEPVQFAWLQDIGGILGKLVGPALLGTLLAVMHLASQRRAEFG